MDQNGVPPQAQSLPATPPQQTPISPRTQLAEQVASGNVSGDGGIFAQLKSNPFFTAGFGLAGLGAALSIGSKGLRQGASLLRRRLLIDVEITRHDESYQWFLHWMTAYQRAQLSQQAVGYSESRFSRFLRRITPSLHHLSMQTTQVTLPNGASQTRFSLVPGPGHHIFRYGRAFIAVNRQREGPPDLQTGRPFETIKLTTLFAHRHVFDDLFREAHALASEASEGKTRIYRPTMTKWEEFGEPKRKRPLESVVLAQGIKERIVEDVRTFVASRNWYLDRGIPYRRGYLLYGSPGTGKSSFIEALAGELDFNIAMLTLSERGLTDDRLNILLATVPARTLVLLEDADAAFTNRTQSDEHGYRGANVTFSGLLNALDGVASAEERIVFLTTNHIEKLDEALIRPGRVDMTIRLGEATSYQIEGLWDRFYVDEDKDGVLKKQFVKKVDSLELPGKVSTAALQGLFLFNKDNPQGAIDMAEELLPRQVSDRASETVNQAAAR